MVLELDASTIRVEVNATLYSVETANFRLRSDLIPLLVLSASLEPQRVLDLKL